MKPLRAVQLVTLRSLETEWKKLHDNKLKSSVTRGGKISDEIVAELEEIATNVSRVHELILILEKQNHGGFK